MAKESKTKYTILGLLNIVDMSGYQMKMAIEKYFIYFWKESWGQIYPTLKKLEKEELVTVTLMEDARKTKTYSITPKGRIEFSEYQMRTPDSITMRSELLLKLFLGRDSDPNVLIKHLENELHDRKQIIQKQSQIILNSETDCDNELDAKYWAYMLRFGDMYNEMISNWCDFVIKDIKKGIVND